MSGVVREVDGEPFLITKHAAGRILDMAIAPDDVHACLACPDEVTESRKYPGCHNWRYGDFVLGIKSKPEAHIVLTAVWATQEAWTADLASNPYSDRELRAHFSKPQRKEAS